LITETTDIRSGGVSKRVDIDTSNAQEMDNFVATWLRIRSHPNAAMKTAGGAAFSRARCGGNAWEFNTINTFNSSTDLRRDARHLKRPTF
jgi:hypothetical protein